MFKFEKSPNLFSSKALLLKILSNFYLSWKDIILGRLKHQVK